ncbi:MAG TPA: hypothetical protein VL172_21190 [Kofleriaceae bacterium]|nr:hypothetical protein [Kofleriaceae bacterium]
MSTAAESERPAAPAATPRVEAAVVGSGPDGVVYRMFEVTRLDGQTAFLGGPLLFEMGEEFLLELRRDGQQARVRARVTRVDRGAAPGVEVELLDPVNLR